MRSMPSVYLRREKGGEGKMLWEVESFGVERDGISVNSALVQLQFLTKMSHVGGEGVPTTESLEK